MVFCCTGRCFGWVTGALFLFFISAFFLFWVCLRWGSTFENFINLRVLGILGAGYFALFLLRYVFILRLICLFLFLIKQMGNGWVFIPGVTYLNGMAMAGNDKVRLKIVGITRSRVQQGAYALVLADEAGDRQVPIIVGTAEAQAIAVSLEGIVPPRPLTHDLFVSFARSFGIRLVEVNVYRFEEGVFSSEMVFADGQREVTVDARTSDAVAIAIRMHVPVFMEWEILVKASVLLQNDSDLDLNASPQEDENLSLLTTERLRRKLAGAVAAELYELAARIHGELRRRGQGE